MELTNLTLPSGIVAVLKPWLTGREKRSLRNVFLKDVEIKTHGSDAETTGFKGSTIQEAEDAAIALVVIELDGKKEDILNRVLDLRSDDYDALLKAINSVTTDERFLAK